MRRMVSVVRALRGGALPGVCVMAVANAPWSSYGYTVDGFAKPEVAAPGRYVIESVPANTSLAAERPYAVVKGGMQLSGTSFAAPVVSGVAADLLGLHPNWTPDQVKGEIMRSATPLGAAANLSDGVGEVNVQRAVGDKGDPPNPNAALDSYLVPDPDGSPYPVFDSASWLKHARSDASWNTASWASASWNTASWLNVLVTDNAADESEGDG